MAGSTISKKIDIQIVPTVWGGPKHFREGHEATDTWLPNAPVSQATGHCHAKFNQFLVLCINHDRNVPLCTCSQVCSAYETPIL